MRYVFHNGQVIEAYKRPPRIVSRSDLPAPYIRSDGMGDTLNPADGRTYDSKSAYERAVKAAGCEIVGNDPTFRNPSTPKYEAAPGLEQDIKTAMEQHGIA